MSAQRDFKSTIPNYKYQDENVRIHDIKRKVNDLTDDNTQNKRLQFHIITFGLRSELQLP